MVELNKISDEITIYARVLADVMHAEIGIADCTPRYIAGTGPLRAQINQDLQNEGHVLRYVLETRDRKSVV